LAWVLLIPLVEGKSTMLKIYVKGGSTQPRDLGRQANRVLGRGAKDSMKDGQEGGQRPRFYAYGKIKVTRTVRIVFLLWLVVSIALILTAIAHACTIARPEAWA
jgi:hypothetical protein